MSQSCCQQPHFSIWKCICGRDSAPSPAGKAYSAFTVWIKESLLTGEGGEVGTGRGRVVWGGRKEGRKGMGWERDRLPACPPTFENVQPPLSKAVFIKIIIIILQ